MLAICKCIVALKNDSLNTMHPALFLAADINYLAQYDIYIHKVIQHQLNMHCLRASLPLGANAVSKGPTLSSEGVGSITAPPGADHRLAQGRLLG